jgi:putative DNA primase/helicase
VKGAPDVNDTLRAEGSDAVRLRLERAQRYNGGKVEETPPQLEEPRPPAFTDEALALRFAKAHANDLRYVAAWGRWLYFDGTSWRFDETLLAFNHARQICRQAAAECKGKARKALASAKTVAAVERLAKADRRLAATVEQWDADPRALNTPVGIIDLQTGNLRPHRPDDYVTKITGVAPNASCKTPIWDKFLDRITGGDAELIAFLQRMAGYALTGLTREHALFFLYGRGANGKTTFLGAIIACASDYHRTAPIETFTATTGERHPTDLAGLRGARLVTAIETEEGRRWAESKIKALTGGDRIAARFMRQDFFEYTPQFKLIIAGNHKPGLRSVDEAIRRRFNLVPFTVTIPPEERDESLPEKLKTELPGILAWMIQGCLDWQKHGLAPPAAVTCATEAYLEAEDAIAAWMDECCERDPNAWEKTATLFASWSTWADKTGEYVGSQRRFVERLESRGITPLRRHDGRGFTGIRLLSPYWTDKP